MNDPVAARQPLFEIPGGWKECQLDIRGVLLHVTIPADPDHVLDALVETFRAAGADPPGEIADPYWAALWSAATPTAEAVLQTSWPPGTRVLELGCGVGLVGLAALARGYEVTFSDYTEQAISVALHNARRNGFPQAQSLVIDWRDAPRGSYDVLLASDVLYSSETHRPLLQAIERLLGRGGVCWIGDPGRFAVQEFLQLASARFCLQLFDRDGREFTVPHTGAFQRLVLRRRDGRC